MRYLLNLISLILLLLFLGCGYGDWDLLLYEQKIEGTSKALYNYDAWGGRDTHVFGYMILDTTEKFDINNRKKLPILYLKEIPSKKLIQAIKKLPYKKEEKETYQPLKTKKINKGKITVKTDYYQSTGYAHQSGGYKELEFESFKETRDSIFFYNLNEFTHMNKGHLDILKIKKGNVYISKRASSDTIQRIRINDLIISNKNQKIISNIQYNLKPKHSTQISAFSDYGIFKEK